MKGAKWFHGLALLFSSLVAFCGRLHGLLPFMLRRTSTALPTSVLSLRVLLRLRGLRSALSATSFVCLSLVISLSFPRVANANPVTITLTVWNAVVTALNIIDSRIANGVAVSAAEDLQVIASNLQVWTGTPSQAQTIAQELERASGYDIDSGNHINTVHSLTGNGSYDQEQICPDCAGGYVATSTGLEVCGTCGGDGMYYWDTVPYTSTHECMLYLASWIRYLSATQTDWTVGASADDYVCYTLGAVNGTSSSGYDDYLFAAQNATVDDDGNVTLLSGTTQCSGYTRSSHYVSTCKLFISNVVSEKINELINDGYDIVLGYKGFYAGRGLSLSSRTTSGYTYRVVACSETFYYYRFAGTTFYYDGNLVSFADDVNESCSTYSDYDHTQWFATEVIESPVAYNYGSSDDSVSWGVDVDWYEDQGAASSAGDTYITNEGDTIYNSETNTYTTNYNIDVEPITQRLDILNAINAQIGTDLRTLDASMFKELNDLEWWLQKIYYMLSSVNNNLENIRNDMANLDRSTNDLVDLSTLESGVSGLSSDIGALLNAVTGSHGSDALGLYGRLDTVLNWLDDFTPVDVSGIEQILEDWPDYPVFDDSDLLNAITGSHGVDLLGLFGRLDNVLSWLDSYVAPDLATLNHQLGDLLDVDGQTPTVHGLIYSVNGYVEDIDGLLSDVLALGTVTVNGTTYGFADLLYNTWLDLSRLVGMSTVTAGEDTYSFADLLYNVWVDFGRLRDWLVEWWADLFARLDDIIDAIEDLPHDGANPWHTSPVVDPSDPQGGPIIGPIETDPYGYPKMPDWTVYKEPLNIPALEHAVDELMTKFPFSMLNTIIQVAMFIERPAVAPQFDIPAPNPSDWSQPYLVHVDLSDYDTVAATLRLGIVIWAIVKISNRTINMWVGDKGGD